jgi:hypothetical protein
MSARRKQPIADIAPEQVGGGVVMWGSRARREARDAAKYLITSTKQIKPSVVKELVGHT